MELIGKITTKYQTNHNGTGQIVARMVYNGKRCQLTKEYGHANSVWDNHLQAAAKLAAKHITNPHCLAGFNHANGKSSASIYSL